MTPAEVCKELGIQSSTLRKYSTLLEKEGIHFERLKNNARKYEKAHLVALQEAIALMDSDDMTLENAIQQASKSLKTSPIVENGSATSEPPQRHADDTAAAMLAEIRSLKEEIRTRDLMFVEALESLHTEIRELKDQQKQLSAPTPTEEELNTAEPQPEAPPAKKKGFLSRLFNK